MSNANDASNVPSSVPGSALLVLLCVALYAPSVVWLPPVDRDESRFAQATKQMLASGDFLRPRFQQEPRDNKPIGIYWLQAGAVALVGSPGSITPYRLPSALGAVLGVLGTFVIGCRRFGPDVGLLAGALLASSTLLVVEASLATTDAVLLACVVGAQAALAEIHAYRERGARPPAVLSVAFWVAQSIGILVKGPVAPVVSLLTIVALRVAEGPRAASSWLGDLRAGWGLAILTAIVGPWAIAVGIASDGDFYRRALHGDILPKVLGGHESHGAPPGYHLALSLATLWPGSLVTVPAAMAAIRERADPAVRLCLAWLVPTWILFELVPTKLPHYVLPTFPAIALLGANVLMRSPHALFTRSAPIAFAIWSGVALALAGAVIALPIALGGSPSLLDAAVALLATATVVATYVLRRELGRAVWVAVLGGGGAFALTLGVVLPQVGGLWPSVRAAEVTLSRAPSPRPPIGAVGYHEPSLVFLLGTDLALLGPDDAARFLAADEHALVWVNDREHAPFETAAAAAGLKVAEAAAVEGWNVSKGRRVTLRLFTRAAPIANGPTGDDNRGGS